MGILKKYITFSTALIFLTLCVSPAIDAELSTTSNQSEISEMITEEITLYKVDINGRMTPVQASITFEKGQDPETAIAEKCKELCKNDKEMKQSTVGGDGPSKWIEIDSKGKGAHWSFRRIIFTNRTIKWRLLIKYRYFLGDGYTKGRYNESDPWITLVEGPQFVRIIGFTGYVNFKPRFFLGSTIIHGYALAIDWGTPRWPRPNY